MLINKIDSSAKLPSDQDIENYFQRSRFIVQEVFVRIYGLADSIWQWVKFCTIRTIGGTKLQFYSSKKFNFYPTPYSYLATFCRGLFKTEMACFSIRR